MEVLYFILIIAIKKIEELNNENVLKNYFYLISISTFEIFY